MSSIYYILACEYMAKTELYDRHLTSVRSKHDKTSAYIVQPELREYSNAYALKLKKELGWSWIYVKRQIKEHSDYSAQKWIDEYYRLMGVDYEKVHD